MRFTAEKPMRTAVIPIGYGFGYPRVRNQGHVLIHGQRAPIIGGVSMDAMTVDITEIIDATSGIPFPTMQWSVGARASLGVTCNEVIVLGSRS
jgi:alanine racemase